MASMPMRVCMGSEPNIRCSHSGTVTFGNSSLIFSTTADSTYRSM